MTVRVLVVGGAGQGRQAIDVLETAGTHVVVGVADRAFGPGEDVAGYRVLGRDDELAACAEQAGATGFLVGIGDNSRRREVFGRVRRECPALEPVAAIHPAAVVSARATIDPGAIVMGGAVVSNDCVVGTGVLLGTTASIDHDCEIGDFASLAPGATLGGGVRIGDCTAIGLNAGVIHATTVGAHTVVGAGALVLESLPDRVVAHGIPASVSRTRQPDEPYLTPSP